MVFQPAQRNFKQQKAPPEPSVRVLQSTTLTATRNPAQADNGWTGRRQSGIPVCVINRDISK